MNHIIFDDSLCENFYPFTLTRPISDFQTGVFTNQQRWEHIFKTSFSHLSKPHLTRLFPTKWGCDNLLINSRILPNKNIVEKISKLRLEESLVQEHLLIALRTASPLKNFDTTSNLKKNPYNAPLSKFENIWDIFSKSSDLINYDFDLILSQKKSSHIPKNIQTLNSDNIFVEENTKLNFCTLNAEEGPIYIGKNTEIMEGSNIRGPFVLKENSQLKIGTKIYGATIIGPNCKIGGEVSNSVFFGNSNKAHDGFIGNSVIGQWCNLGAGSTNSNLKNDYSDVMVWNEPTRKFINTKLQFCGLFLGDHSKSAINTTFNTGTVAGPHANIFIPGLTKRFIKPFTWGNGPYRLDKAIKTAERVLERRQRKLTNSDLELMTYINQYY